jgi:hypothetical protein
MKYTTRISYLDVLGIIWMPRITASLHMPLSDYDVDNIIGYSNEANSSAKIGITREGVMRWLNTHAGDFSEIADFSGSIEHPATGETIDFEWSTEDNEIAYYDTLPQEDY